MYALAGVGGRPFQARHLGLDPLLSPLSIQMTRSAAFSGFHIAEKCSKTAEIFEIGVNHQHSVFRAK
jgi:hypothetical protein